MENKQRVRLNGEGEIEAGLGGEHNGETLQELAEGNGKPEEKNKEGEKEKQKEAEKEKKEESKTESTTEKGEEKQEQVENTESEILSHIKIDFSKDNILPALNQSDAEELGVKPLPVRLKKSILERQASKHPETIKDTEQIISSAVYSPDVKLPGKQPGYMHFIKQLKKDSHSLVLLDLKESDDGYYDIVHYFKIDDRDKRRISRRANKTS